MMNVSFIGVIILTAYVACLYSTDPYELPALNLIKSSKLKQLSSGVEVASIAGGSQVIPDRCYFS